MTAFQLTPLLLANDPRSPLSAVSPLSSTSAKKRKWSHDILASSSTVPSTTSSANHSTTASPATTFRSLSLRPANGGGSGGDDTDEGSEAELDGGKRSRATGGAAGVVRWVRIQVEQDDGPSVVTHSSPPPPSLSSQTAASFFQLPTTKASAARTEDGASRLLALASANESKTSSQPITRTVGDSSSLSLSPPTRPRASTTPVTPSTGRSTPVGPAMHIKAADYHAFINSLPSATKKHKRRRPAVAHSQAAAAAVAPPSHFSPKFGSPVPPSRMQFTLPSVVLARKAAALAARGGQVVPAESPYAIPSPPPLTSSQPLTPYSQKLKEVKLEDVSGGFMRSSGSFMSLPSASPVSSISAYSCPSSSPQSVSSSSVSSPMFGPYPFNNLSLSSSTSSISSLPSFHRRFSVPSITSSLPISPVTTTATTGKPPLSRPRSSVHLRHPAIAQRMNKPGGRWRKLQTALRLNRRWQSYKQAMTDGPSGSGPSNGEDRSGDADSEDDEDEDSMDVDDDDIIDEEDDDGTVTEEEADSSPAATVSSSPYNPYAADNRVFVTARPPPPPLQLLQPSSSTSSSSSISARNKRPSQLASRRHTNPTNSSSSLLTIASSYIQSKRVPNSPSPLPLPLSPHSPMSPAPKSPSSASFHSRHISMMSAQQQQQGSRTPTPSTGTRSLSSYSSASSSLSSPASAAASTGIFIDHFALCLTLQFCDLRTLLHCKRINWLWYEHASSPLSWLSSRYRLLVAEEGAEPPSTVPLPRFATHLPVAVPSVPRFHTLSSTFCDTLTVSMRYLRSLDISSLPSGLSVQWLSSLLSAVPFLHTLSLSYNPWLTDEHLQLLPAQLPRLRYLDVSSCSLISRDGVAPLAQLALLSLDLSSSSLSDDDVDVLAPMTSLLSLNLSCNKHLTSECMEWLCGAMPQLLILDTSWTTIIAASPQSLRSPTQSHSQSQHGLPSPTSQLAPVAQLTSLLILNLSYSKHLDDDMLRSVRCCHALHTLDLFSCQEVTDQGLRWLCGADDSSLGEHEQQQLQPHAKAVIQRESGSAEAVAEVEQRRESRSTQPGSPTSFPINFAFASPRLLQSAPPSPPLLSSSRASSIGTLALPLSTFTLSSSRPASPVQPRRLLSAASSGASIASTPGRLSNPSTSQPSLSSCPLPSLASLSIGAIPLLSSSAIGSCLPLLPSLIAVDLQFTRVDDGTLLRLSEGWRRRADRRQAGMRSVQCSWCRYVTEEGRQRMRERLPHCQVV